jgi:hypothetical protein
MPAKRQVIIDAGVCVIEVGKWSSLSVHVGKVERGRNPTITVRSVERNSFRSVGLHVDEKNEMNSVLQAMLANPTSTPRLARVAGNHILPVNHPVPSGRS